MNCDGIRHDRKIYGAGLTEHCGEGMTHWTYRATLLALYQIAVVLGIALLPVALAVRRMGVHLPVGRLVEHLGNAYDAATTEPEA